jgi:hypothetical protein
VLAIKLTLSSLACALLAVAAFACGEARSGEKPASARSAPTAARVALPQIETKGDPDDDHDKYPGQKDYDESPYYKNEPFGHPASPPEARGAAAVVKRYFADAAREDGASACPLIYSPRAEVIPDELDGAPRPPGKRPVTCGFVLSRLFREMHSRLSAESATLRVGAVRVEFNQGSVQLHFAHVRLPHYIEVHRERGAWKMGILLDLDRPVGIE